MKKLGHFKYTSLFLSHVEEFLLSFLGKDLMQREHLISVSGGVDSMVLLFVANKLRNENKIGPIRALFLHHQTRSGQDEEQKLVEQFCLDNKISFVCQRIEGLNPVVGNFEELARIKRKKMTFEILRPHEFLWQGHHIDDSFEWHFMQKSKSHHLKSTLGIPVRNGVIARPLLCVTKNQIRRFAKLENIPYQEDPTNLDLDYERNYLRNKVIPLIKEKYPNYLSAYVSQASELAHLLGFSLIKRQETPKIRFKKGDLFLEEVISKKAFINSIEFYSNAKRGELSHQVDRVQKAIENKKKGPFHFSGNVMAYASGGNLLVCSKTFKNEDKKIAQVLEHLKEDQLKELRSHSRQSLLSSYKKILHSDESLAFMPYLALVIEPKNIQKNLNTSVYDPMFPMVSEICRNRGWRFVAIKKCLNIWEKKQKRLSKTLKIYPLYELYHLFSFQE